MTLTQEDLQAIGTLINTTVTESIKTLPTKEETKEIVYTSKMELYDEMNRQYIENDKRFTNLESIGDKVDTLLMQSDNTALLLRLINKQAEELESLKAEVQEIKKKLA